jgi:hypothetical protein
MAVVDEFSLFKAIVAGESLETIRAIVEERPQSVQERPERPPDVKVWEWPSNSLSTALHAAIEYGLPDASVRFVYRCWPQALQKMDSKGNTPWHMLQGTRRISDHDAGENNAQLSLETVQLFVHEFPRSLLETNLCSQTVLHAAAAATRGYFPLNALQLIFEQHPEAIAHRSGSGSLPLHDALGCPSPSTDIAGFLLQQFPAATRVRNDEGRLPLHVAAENCALTSLRAITTLVEGWHGAIVEPTRYEFAGRRPDDEDGGYYPVHLVAAREGPPGPTLRILRYFLLFQPEAIRLRTNHGYTPLHWAVKRGAPLVVIRFLVLQRRESLAEWTSDGNLPLHLAVTHGAPLPTFTFLADQHPEAVRQVKRDGDGCLVLHSVAAGGYPSPDAIRICVRHWPDSVRTLSRLKRAPIHGAVNIASGCCGRLLREAVHILAGIAPEMLRIYDAYGHIPLHILLLGKDPPVEVAKSLVEAWPRSVLVPTFEKQKRYALFLAAANPEASLDVLYYLVQQWPAHFFRRGRP